ncbi:putative sensor protein [Leptospira ellinghausenii]|uniref:histidine kinase n=1 Tax=Leptospira ellinghausenii TaxID=1917822 RepID=A0A2P2DF94_9LEPT|nr:PAS domain S-box protein [Leptospira ellinghausenii]GBF43296.1 putative sensor protein [Leptospira ellinghausenii]
MIEQYFRAILDNSPENIVLLGKNHEVLAFNQTIQNILYKYHNILLQVGDLYYPKFVIEENRNLYLQAFESAINGKPFITQNYTSNENVSLWFEYKMQPVYIENNLLGVTLTAKDITAEKEAELKIIDLSEKLKAILDNTDESITLLDLNYKILAINEIGAKTLTKNTNANTFIGNDFREYVPDETNLFYHYYNKAIKGEKNSIEIPYQNFSGESIIYQTKFNPVYDRNQIQIGVSIFAKDITDKKRLEGSLLESEERFRKITELAPVGIIITDDKLKISYANSYVKKLLGYTLEDLLDLNISNIIQNIEITENGRIEVDKLDLGLKDIFFDQEKFKAIRKDKQINTINLSSTLIVNQKKSGYIFVFQDVTSIESKNTKIEEQNRKLRDIAWYQSHVIRSPLSRIMGLISLLEDNKLNSEETDFCYQSILESAHELDEVIHKVVNKVI